MTLFALSGIGAGLLLRSHKAPANPITGLQSTNEPPMGYHSGCVICFLSLQKHTHVFASFPAPIATLDGGKVHRPSAPPTFLH